MHEWLSLGLHPRRRSVKEDRCRGGRAFDKRSNPFLLSCFALHEASIDAAFLRDYAVFASESARGSELAFRPGISCGRRAVGVVFPFEIPCRHGNVARKRKRTEEEGREKSKIRWGFVAMAGGRSWTSGSRLWSNGRGEGKVRRRVE